MSECTPKLCCLQSFWESPDIYMSMQCWHVDLMHLYDIVPSKEKNIRSTYMHRYTKILEVYLFAFAYRLFHEDFPLISGALHAQIWTVRVLTQRNGDTGHVRSNEKITCAIS